MFSTEERARIRDQLLKRAEADDAIVGAAYTGSLGTDAGDRWSDTDLVLAVRGELAPTLNRWTDWLYQEHKAQHHWDLPVGPKLIRVFLLPGWLELDLTFAPEADFAPRGPQWQTIFGQAQPLDPYPPTDRDLLAGLLWHHALHARICLARRRWWQAEHWIAAMRDHVITMACAAGPSRRQRQGCRPAARRPDRTAAGHPGARTHSKRTPPRPDRHHRCRDRRDRPLRPGPRRPPAPHARRTRRPSPDGVAP